MYWVQIHVKTVGGTVIPPVIHGFLCTLCVWNPKTPRIRIFSLENSCFPVSGGPKAMRSHTGMDRMFFCPGIDHVIIRNGGRLHD